MPHPFFSGTAINGLRLRSMDTQISIEGRSLVTTLSSLVAERPHNRKFQVASNAHGLFGAPAPFSSTKSMALRSQAPTEAEGSAQGTRWGM